jgi:uncharacterized protein (TIGR01244 family)
MKPARFAPVLALLLTISCASPVDRAGSTTIAGVRNFTEVDPTVACAGATDVDAIPRIAARGYKTIVNLRLSTEPGAAIEASRTAAAAAGIGFVHLPFNSSAPDAAVVDAFITTVTDPARQPVFINCASANRAGALWLAKRLVVDKWDQAKAVEEARRIGLSSVALEKFAIDYAMRISMSSHSSAAAGSSKTPRRIHGRTIAANTRAIPKCTSPVTMTARGGIPRAASF